MNATRLPEPRGFRPVHLHTSHMLDAVVACLALGVWIAGYVVLCPPDPHQGPVPHQIVERGRL